MLMVADAQYNILIVDDFAAFRRFAISALRQISDFLVAHEAADGLEAVGRAKQLQPDLILLDISLPGINGIEAARQIRRVSPNSKVLFFTQESSVEVMEEALRVGAHGYLLKSDANELSLALDEVLNDRLFVSSRLRPGTVVGNF